MSDPLIVVTSTSFSKDPALVKKLRAHFPHSRINSDGRRYTSEELREVLGRRFGRALELGTVLPDLVLIDGGRGQLNVGLQVLQDLGLDYIPVISLAKQQEEVYQGDSREPLLLDPTSPALHTLQKIRDEAHRFAITYHKKLRSQRTIQSALDAIPERARFDNEYIDHWSFWGDIAILGRTVRLLLRGDREPSPGPAEAGREGDPDDGPEPVVEGVVTP